MAKFYSSAVPEYQADKEQFEFVQMKDDIADATFQDKPIGFFKDAMLRFCRSKVSIVAFVGIVIILFMAIFMPMISCLIKESAGDGFPGQRCRESRH